MTDRFRILQLSSCADALGGAERHFLAIADAQRAQGHEVRIFGTSPDRSVDDDEARVVQRAPFNPDELFRDETVTEALRETLESFKPDVVHLHNLYGLPLTIETTLVAHGCAVMQTVHDYSSLCPNSWCVRGDGSPCRGGAGMQCYQHDCGNNYPYNDMIVAYTRLRQRLLASLLRVAVAPSQALVDRLRDNDFPDARLLPYFIEPRFTARDDASDPRFAERFERDLILFAGRLDMTKGVEYLIEAMTAVRAAHPAAKLAILGDGPESASLRALATERGLDGTVAFHGAVSYDEVESFMARAAFIVVPSVWSENSPLTLYECMDAGLPAIGSRIGGIPELVLHGETGFVATPRDANDLAGRMIELLAAPELRIKMARRQRERVSEFSLAAHLDRLNTIYQEITQRAPAAAARQIDPDLLFVLSRMDGNRRVESKPPSEPENADAGTPGDGTPPVDADSRKESGPAQSGLWASAKRFLFRD